MRSSKRKDNRLGRLVFFIPLVVIVSFVVYGFFQLTAPGTLKVEAIAHDQYVYTGAGGKSIQVSVTVEGSSGGNTQSGTTPASFSLSSGTYTVTYGPIEWYTTPADKTVAVPNGKTVYADAVYDVIPSVISIAHSGFNSTEVSALHGVTPVIWVNTSGSDVVLNIQSIGNVALASGQNFTKVFQSVGSLSFTDGFSTPGTLQVS